MKIATWGLGLAAAGAFATLVQPAGAAAAAPDPSVVTTASGAVRGTAGPQVRSFQGIPYATAARWAAPRPPAAWSGVRDATVPGPSCAQPKGYPIGVPNDREQECLVVNVTAPAKARGRLPVIVWVHGGSMVYGTGDFYGPDRLAAEGAVVVSMNYRLGALAFLAHPSLKESGNLALQDQQAALRWVRANAAAFGGDARNVTIMGESAGGYGVCGHLASPASAGLFDKAIVQSAPCAEDASRTRAQAEADSEQVIKDVGCEKAADTAACLRDESKVSTAGLLAAYGTRREPKLISGTPLLPLPPGEALRTGRFNRVPVLIGVNHDEENGMVLGAELATGRPTRPEEYVRTVREEFGAQADAVLKRYPVRGSAGETLARVKTDARWAAPTLDTARALSRWTPTRMYEFAERDTPWFAGYPAPSFPARAQHMAELPYLFDLEKLFGEPTRAQARLGERMTGAWARFAATGDPNGGREASWPRLRPNDWHVQSLTSAAWRRADYTRDHAYRFWSDLRAARG
ncbi:carboxylesterase/lipase family protein [Spirillospora sp. NPDC050679]